MSVQKEIKKVTTNTLQKMKAAGEKISMLTAYDFSFAKIIDGAGMNLSFRSPQSKAFRAPLALPSSPHPVQA